MKLGYSLGLDTNWLWAWPSNRPVLNRHLQNGDIEPNHGLGHKAWRHISDWLGDNPSGMAGALRVPPLISSHLCFPLGFILSQALPKRGQVNPPPLRALHSNPPCWGGASLSCSVRKSQGLLWLAPIGDVSICKPVSVTGGMPSIWPGLGNLNHTEGCLLKGDRVFLRKVGTGAGQAKKPGALHLNRCCCSAAQSRLTFCDPMDCSMPGFSVLRYLLEFAQTHVHWVDGDIQPSHPLLPASPPALNLSQPQGLIH